MFGMGFTEILMIAIVAILFLGPDKLPEAMVQVGKFFNSFRKTINEAKSTFEEELNIRELREEALSYRQTLEEASQDISGFKNSLPNPAEEVREAFKGVDLEEDSLDDDWNRDLDEIDEEFLSMQEEKHKVAKEGSTRTLQEAQKASSQPETRPEEAPQEQLAHNEEERPRTFKNLSRGGEG